MSENIGAELGRKRKEKEELENQSSQFFGTNREVAEAKREYYRKYYAQNKEKYKENNKRYWEKKAQGGFFYEE